MLTRGLPYTNYVVQFNTGSGFTATNVFGPYLSQGQTNDNGNSGGPGWAGLQTGVVRLIDINGDGLPDRVMLPIDTTGTTQNGPQPMYKETNFVVELNNGYGFEPAIIWTNVNPYYNLTNGGAYTPGIADLGDDYQVALRDVNGDGLPDRIIACVFSYFNGVQTGYTNWFVQLNTGNGFANAINWGPTYNQGYNTDTNVCGIQATKATLIDINGDGLPDRVEAVYSPTLSSTYFVVSLSAGPFPDLLTVASNGLGGAVTATYKPSTQYDNTESPGASPTRQLLPFPQYTASSVSVYDGINPANTTTYAYSGGYWNFALRQFNGFAQATEVDPLLTTNIHWFHQAGGRNNSSYGEYADTTNTLGKEGMEYRTDTIGWDGNPYRLVLNQVGETLLNNLEHFGYVSQTIDIDYPATSGAYKAVAKQFFYDVSNGNLTNETDWGAVNGVNISQQSFTDISGDTVYHLTQFASLSNTNIVDKPQTVTLSLDSAGANILRQGIYSYDGGTGNVLQERHLICPGTYRTNSYGYDGYNNKAWSTNAAGIVTQTTYDSAYKTFPAQSTTASTFTTTTIYDPRSGKLAYSVNPAGMATTNLLDAFLRLTETEVSTTQNGAPTEWIEKYSYTLGVSGGVPNDSAIIEQNDGVDTSNGHEVIRYSDGFGRIVQAREQSETGNFRVIDTVYDPRGNPLFVSLPYFDSSSTSFVRPSGSELGTLHEYDSIGRPSKVSAGQNATFNGTSHLITGISATGGDPGVSPLGTNILAYYNNVTADPWTLVVTDEAGKVHQFVLDAYGRTNQIVEVTSGGNFTTTFTYNMAGDLLSVTDNAGHQIQYAYNDIGELIAMADPDMGNWQYERDYAGRLNHQIDGDGQRIDFNYSDPLGRLASRQVYDLRGGFVRGVTNIYDSTDDGTFPVYPGQLYKVIDSEGYSKTGYDVRGRKIIAARYVAKNGNSYTNRYTSDDMDRVTSIVYPNGGPTITNIYDHGANLYEVQQVGGSGTLFYKATAFTALDQIAGITYGNTVTASNIYYANSHRLKSIATTKGTNIQSLAYTYDQVADVKSITDGVYSDGGSASVTNITYDDLHRLTSLYRPTLSQTVNFSYDSIGNMTSSGENGGAYTYAPALPHAVHNANGQNYAYDRCGNMLVRGNQSLVYDQENRLIAVVASNLVTTFGYDEGGARLWKQGPTNTLQVWIDGNYEEKDGKILYHISAGDRVVCTFDASNTVFEYYHPDHLHSAEILSDNAGNLYQHYEYSAYGQSRYTLSSAAFPISRRYTSQVLDEETGLYFYASRYYDPQLGRFIQPDTIIPQEFNPQAYDRYAYALDNPFRFTDPSGHAGKEVADWWEGHVNRVYSSLTEGSESTLYLGTMGTVNSIVGGIVEPLRLGSDAGRVSVTGGTAGEVTVVVVQEGLRTISLVPVGSAIGKGAGTLVKAAVKSGGEEVAGEMAGELSGCFVAGTLVPCETGDVEIQNVKIGSRVWSYSFQSGEWELRTVEATPVHDYEGDVVTLQIGEVTIEATGNHPFWVISGSDLASRPPALDIPIDQRAISQSGRWVEARSLREGDTLLPLSGRIVVLDSVSTRHDHTPVYNLRVEGNHTYSVSQLRVLVHNKAAQIKQVPKADEGRLVRFGKGPETAEQLGEQSAKAEAAGFPHGVSTKLKPRTSGSDKLHRSAPKSEVEQAFPVKQTGSDPTHHTVILPKPVTPEAAETFNQVFTPKTGQ
jgi:RHS repeat-associated protein